MSILPQWHKGRVCIPWWYGLGYPILWCSVGLAIGIRTSDISMIELDFYCMVATVICALVGALVYVVYNAVSKYEKQRTDAAQLRDKIALSGRDPTNTELLTAAEKWDLTKAQKFDRLFVIVDVLAVLISAGLAIACVWLYGAKYLTPDAWVEYAVVAFFAGIVVALFLDVTVISAIGTSEWEKKKQAAFQSATSIVEQTATKAVSRRDELVQDFIAKGCTRKEAEALAKEALLAELKQ